METRHQNKKKVRLIDVRKPYVLKIQNVKIKKIVTLYIPAIQLLEIFRLD